LPSSRLSACCGFRKGTIAGTRRNGRDAPDAVARKVFREALSAGVDWIFHAVLATEGDLDTVARAGFPIMPAFTQGEIWPEHAIGVAPAMRDRLKTQLDVNIKGMAGAKARGIRLLLGTDSGNAAVMTPGKWRGYEAGFFVKHLGYTPLEAIVLQTRENALAMRLEGKLGTIEPGMIADIVILDVIPAETSRCWATRPMSA